MQTKKNFVSIILRHIKKINVCGKKEIFSLLIVLTLAIFPTYVFAQSLGTITVYVKDQNGKNVQSNDNLIGDVLVELWYEGEIEKSVNLTKSNPENVSFDITHTGLYTLRAVATFRLVEEVGFPSGFPSTCFPVWFGVDEKGVYDCTFLYEEVGDVFNISYYNVTRTYVLTNDVLTYVDEGENDIAQVTIPTNKESLWKFGRNFYEKVRLIGNETQIYVRNESGVYKENVLWYYLVGGGVVQEGIDDIIDKGADKFVKGAVAKAIKALPLSTVVYVGATDPENLFTEETGYGLLTGFATGVVAEKIAVAAGVTSSGGLFAIAVVAATAADYGVTYSFDERAESYLCNHAETDDLDIYIGQSLGECSTIYCDTCQEYPLHFVNKGEMLSNIYVGDDLDKAPFGLCCYYFNDKKSTKIADEVDIYEIKGMNISYAYDDNYICKLKFNDTGRLWHEIEVLPGTKCNFDTLDSLPLPNYDALDVPPLSKFQKHNPYIGLPSFPEVAYVGDSTEIKVRIVDGIGLDQDQTFIGCEDQYVAKLNLSEGDIFDGVWIAKFTIPAETEVMNFFLVATNDKKQTVNDNDQRMFKIEVVEDADSGGDAPDDDGNSLVVGLSQDYNGYLVLQEGDTYDFDWYKFNVEKGQIYSLDLSTDGILELELHEPGECGPLVTEFLLYGQGTYQFTAAGTGEVHLGFKNMEPTLNGQKYTFNAQVTGSGWTEPKVIGDVTHSDTSRNYFYVCGCWGVESRVNCCSDTGLSALGGVVNNSNTSEGNYSTLSIYGIDVENWRINGQGLQSFMPGDEVDLGTYTLNGREYFDVTVQVGNFVGEGKTVEVYKIIPRVNDVLKTDDATSYNFVQIPYLGYELFDAKVPICLEKGECKVEMKVFYRVAQAAYFKYSLDPFILDVQIQEPPLIDSFQAIINFDSVDLVVKASDNEELDMVKYYIDDPNENNWDALRILDGKHDTATYTLSTTDMMDGSTHSAHVLLSNKQYNPDIGTNGWARSDEITFTVRKDEGVPEITELQVSGTEQGNVYGRNVSGEVRLSAVIYDTESGLDNIIWKADGVTIGTSSIFTWDTSGLEGQKTLEIKASDQTGNLKTKTYTINIDNTPPTVYSTIPENNDILEGIANLRVEASDDNTGVAEVDWFIELAGENIRVGSGDQTIWGSGGLNGEYTLTVNVTDLVGNTQTRNIPVNIISPDLSLTETDVTVTGDNVTAVIRNLGSADAEDITINAYNLTGKVGSGVIDNLLAGETQAIEIHCNNTQGRITVVVDLHNSIPEISEENNLVEVSQCPDGGILLCGESYCCGDEDEICLSDFGVGCEDPDCESSNCTEGISLCGIEYCCGINDDICPGDYGVSCTDPDCPGIILCSNTYYCGVTDQICPQDYGVSCSYDPEC